jgi:anti-sigma B factor antagonist
MSAPDKFGIIQNRQGDINCLYLKGFLDAHTAPELETEIGKLIKNGQNKILVVFRDLDYISSAGLGVFMAFIEEVRDSGGDIKLANMKPKVFSVFDLLGFPMLFDIEQDENFAMEKFALPKV